MYPLPGQTTFRLFLPSTILSSNLYKAKAPHLLISYSYKCYSRFFHYKKNSLRQHTLHSGLEKFRCANPTYNGEIFFLNIPLSESGTDIGYINYCLCGNLQNLTDKLYFWKCCVTLLTQWSSNRCESRWLRQWFLTQCCVIQTAVTFHLKK